MTNKNIVDTMLDLWALKGMSPDCDLFVWMCNQSVRLDGLEGNELIDEQFKIAKELVQNDTWKTHQCIGAFDALTNDYDRPLIEPKRTEWELFFINKLLETYGKDGRTRFFIRKLIAKATNDPNLLSNESLQTLLNFDNNVVIPDKNQRKFIVPLEEEK